jgi:hypothetical protein
MMREGSESLSHNLYIYFGSVFGKQLTIMMN